MTPFILGNKKLIVGLLNTRQVWKEAVLTNSTSRLRQLVLYQRVMPIVSERTSQ